MADDQDRQAHGSVITVEAKVAGRRRPVVTGWHVPLPSPPLCAEGGAGDGLTLRALLTTVVAHEVRAYRDRQEERRLAQVLSPDAIRLGIIAEVLGFRQFSLRGQAAAAGEWCLVCLAFNLKRFHVLSRS